MPVPAPRPHLAWRLSISHSTALPSSLSSSLCLCHPPSRPQLPARCCPPFTRAACRLSGPCGRARAEGRGQRGQLGPEKVMARRVPRELEGSWVTVPGSPVVPWLVRLQRPRLGMGNQSPDKGPVVWGRRQSLCENNREEWPVPRGPGLGQHLPASSGPSPGPGVGVLVQGGRALGRWEGWERPPEPSLPLGRPPDGVLGLSLAPGSPDSPWPGPAQPWPPPHRPHIPAHVELGSPPAL